MELLSIKYEKTGPYSHKKLCNFTKKMYLL